MPPKAKFTKEQITKAALGVVSEKGAQTFDDIYSHLGSVADECLDVLQKDYDLNKDNAKILFEHVWIHTFGIGVLCSTGVCNFSHEQIAEMLTQDFTAMMMLMKSGKPNQPKM